MKNLPCFLILFLSLSFGSLRGQLVRLSDDPAQFVVDVEKMMSYGGTPQFFKASQHLKAVWIDPRFTNPQQSKVMAMVKKLVSKGYKANPQFVEMFDAIHAAINIHNTTPAAMDEFLTVAGRITDSNDPKLVLKFFEQARLLYESRLLYNSNYNKLYALGGTFSFRYTDTNTEVIRTVETAKKDDGWNTAAVISDSTGNAKMPAYQKRQLPTASGAVIDFEGIDLVMVTFNDSTVLAKTSGVLSIKEGFFVGKNGRFTWEVAGDPSIAVQLSEYVFNINTPKISADDVTLLYETRLAKPIKGVFDFESKRRPRGAPSNQPVFVSYTNDAVLRSFSANIRYRGGLTLLGKNRLSSSLNNVPSEITVLKDNKVAFRAKSTKFILSDTVVTAPLASFVTAVGKRDSLYHPGVRFMYSDLAGLLKLDRADGTSYSDVPYTDTYHKMYVYSEMMRWSFMKNQLEFYVVSGKAEVPIKFESFGFYKPERFSAISSEFGFHPLLMAANFVQKQKVTNFTPYDMATFYKKDEQVIRGSLNQMVRQSYLENNPEADLYALSKKGILYILANINKTDYDNFQITSLFNNTESLANASIDLADTVLTIRGVSSFTISDSLKIYAMPSDKQIRMGRNRDFTLNGQLKSANFRFKGNDLRFNYDKFFVDLTKIESITFVPQSVYSKGGSTEIGEDVKYEKSGRIYLNDPANKSGKSKNSVFPRLSVPEGMTVFFDQPDRGSLAYNKKTFFKIPSIDYDSLGMADIVFLGTFHSDGIFPDFKAELRTMPDNSLGFEYRVPAAGFKAYGTNTNVKFGSNLIMDKKGLRAKGEIAHLSARVPTQDMLFMTDSLTAFGSEAEIKEMVIGKAYFPKVEMRNYTMRWVPRADSMSFSTKGNTFNFYNASTKLDGRVVLRSTGLYGRGQLKRDDSELLSQDIKFNKEGFSAGESQFKIVSTLAQNSFRPVLLGQNVDIDFNVVKGSVGIATNNNTLEASSSVEFPFAAYRTSINRAQWNINAKTIAMKGDVLTSTFTATAPEQEGLIFNGSAALYEIEKMTLSISGVPYIKSADAKVLPEKGLVTIRRNGDMQPFRNARLLLDTLNEYHRLKNGNITIASRNKFSGDATYQYITIKNDSIPVKMGNFELRPNVVVANSKNKQNTKTFFTAARAEITETDNFIISPRIQYKGSMTMLAPEPNLQFNGYLKPIIKKRVNLVSSWIGFKEIPTKNISIKIDQTLKNEVEDPLFVGLHYRSDADGLYPTFLSTKESKSDQNIFLATGSMSFNEAAKSFRIVPKAKSENDLIDEQNAYTFNDTKSLINYTGVLNFMRSEKTDSKDEMFMAAGMATANVDSNVYKFNTLLSFNFPAAPQAMAEIAKKIVEENLENKNDDPAEPNLDRLAAKLTALIGAKQAETYLNRRAADYRPLTDASSKFNAAVVLSNVDLRWSAAQNSFYSLGGTIGVSNLGSNDINAQMDGYVEIRKRNKGDEVSIYMEVSPEVWYFMDWQDGQLGVVSSDYTFNEMLSAKGKGEKSKEKDLKIVPLGFDERNAFLERCMNVYKTKARPQPKVVAKAPPATKNAKNAAAANPAAVAEPEVAAAKPKLVPVLGKDGKPLYDKYGKAVLAPAPADPKVAGKDTEKEPAAPGKKPAKKKEEEKEGF